EDEIVSLKRAANALCQLEGREPVYAEVEQRTERAAYSIRRDQWYGQPLSTAVREYLSMRRASNRGPATVNEIYEALANGGFLFEAKGAENAKRGLRISLRKNSSIFHRLPDGSYGLIEWYPEAKARKDREPEEDAEDAEDEVRPTPKKVVVVKRKRPTVVVPQDADDEADADAEPYESPDDSDDSDLPTVESAVREAVETQEGEFTKPSILKWIEIMYPGLRPHTRRNSIFTTITRLRDELGLVPVREGKGGEPTVYRRSSKAKSNGQH
ncbi:MAG TPA: hypothetical protein VFQ39_05150, partial [Longimicrobium sp.]|nr:hypothetical protein [Longimicrobium sp.]